MAPEFEGVVSSDDTFFAWWDDENITSSAMECLGHLDAYVASEGPFDGIIAFSQGATVAGIFLAHRMKMNAKQERAHPTFKCAVFISSDGVYEINDSPNDGGIHLLTPEEDGEVIQIPTAHIWGSNDTTVNAETTLRMCSAATREFYVHSGSHEVPGTRMKDDVRACVKIIRRVIAAATHGKAA